MSTLIFNFEYTSWAGFYPHCIRRCFIINIICIIIYISNIILHRKNINASIQKNVLFRCFF
jgi:hypothetical protein